MRIVLNELSFENGVFGTASLWYDTFFSACISIGKELGKNISVISTIKPLELILHDLPFPKWISTIDKERKRLIISMLTREPILLDYPYYSFEEANAKGLGFAYENDLLPLSLNNHEKWKNLELSLELEYLDESIDKVITDEVQVKHAWDAQSSMSHLDYLKKNILIEANKKINELESGQQLWDMRETMFPGLVFCAQIESQISYATGELLRKIGKRLVHMNSYFIKWNDGDFDRNSFGGNPRLESETRLKDFKDQLTIQCPDQSYRIFSYHCNFGFKGMRLHFHPDGEKRICWIGYIGKKIV